METNTISAQDPLEAYDIHPDTRRFISENFEHFIGGARRASVSGDRMQIFDPSAGRAFASVAAGSADDVDFAARSARQAYDDGRWRNIPPHEKERILRRLADLIDANRTVFSDLNALEGGLIRNFSNFVIQYGIDTTNYYAGWPTKIQGSVPATTTGMTVIEARDPIGVVGVIFPWNAPSTVSVAIVPALACGNSVVFKPAEQTPFSALFFAHLCQEAGIPDGVVNVVLGTGSSVGAAIVAHPLIEAISFTGSVETGRRIQAEAAKHLKRVSLELGGKSPHILFEDADLELAVQTAASAVFSHSGQLCIAGSRILVQRRIYKEVVDRLVHLAEVLKIGSAFAPETEAGPVVSQKQLDQVCRYVSIGRDEGATLVTGGNRIGDDGYFHQPTVFTEVANDMTIAREEIFGPVACVIPFDDEAEAYAIGNDTQYGLAAGVWTRDFSRAHRASQRLHAGTVWVNTYFQADPCVSYGGLRQSGHGRTLGHASIEELTQVRSLWFAHG